MKLPYKELDRLISLFSRVPGIGERGALRIALFLAGTSPAKGREIARSLLKVVDGVGRCVLCNNIAFGDLCWICSQRDRDRSLLLMVETVMDLISFEDAGYRGLYQVVSGFLPTARRISEVQKREALERVLGRVASGEVREVILGFPYTVRGEALFRYYRDALSGKVALSRLARGIPAGSDVEFVDSLTLSFSLTRRERI